MAKSIVRVPLQDSSPKQPPARADISERRLRQWGAWIILYLLFQAESGLAWDRNWHDLVGRDSFWIPPHIMLYSGLGGAGLVTLCIILIDSYRYARHRPGVDDSSTTHVFWLFHAPLGFILLGFGALTDLLAAPFDNYWHELYGIDVTLWSPFHIMGTIGGVLAGIGSVFILASEAAHERDYPGHRFLGLNGPEWGAIVQLAAFVEVALPALTAFTPLTIGSLSLPTYPLILVFAGSGCIAAVALLTHKRGAATLMACVLWLECLITQAFIPWALNTFVPLFGQSFRYTGITPHFNTTIALMPILVLLGAMIFDGVIYLRHDTHLHASLRWLWLPAAIFAVFAVIVPSAITHLLISTHAVYMASDVLNVLNVGWSNLLLALLPAILFSIGSALLGAFFGDIFYRSEI